MKYYKLSKDGEDLNVILACENEEFERKAFEKYGKDYTLTECECPKDAHIVMPNEKSKTVTSSLFIKYPLANIPP